MIVRFLPVGVSGNEQIGRNKADCKSNPIVPDLHPEFLGYFCNVI